MAELGMDAQLDPFQKLFIGDKLDIVRSPNQTDCPMTSLAKLYRFGHIFFRWQIQRASILDYLPEEVSIEVTNVCNFKCAFCPQSQPDHHDHVPKTYLEPEAADLILRRLREGGIQTQTLHWTLDGEPFMNRRFGELCDAALRHGFSNMYFATNGMLLTEDIIARLPTHSGARYTFTIDFAADKPYFEDVRGTQGSWQRIFDNIARILLNPDLTQFHIELSDISTYRLSDPLETDRKYTELRALFSDPNSRLNVFQKTFHNAAGLVEKHVTKSGGKKYHLCPYPWTSLFVASNGDIVACCRDLRRQTVLGNILKKSLSEIWNGAAFQELRRNLVDKKPELSAACNGCDLPYDDAKFSVENMLRTARRRLQLFNS
jgi:radical SAM protein with 4Fe4S-binding SPASM domain